MTALADAPDRRALRNVIVLVAAQAVLGSQMSMLFIVGGLAGKGLATNPCLATLPISLIVLGSMLTAPVMSSFMQRHGRRAGFVAGALGGAAGGAIGAWGLWIGSFPILLAGSLLSGIYMSAQGFYRFAAADGVSESFRPKAISYVLAGGLASALIGPQLNKLVAEAFVVPFVGTYLAVTALSLTGLVIFRWLDVPTPAPPPAGTVKPSWGAILRRPRVAVAIVCAMVSYGLMNLVMTSTPLAVVGCGFSVGQASDIVSAHVVAMFAPSFFTGHLIARFGVERIIAAGLILLAGAAVTGLAGVEIGNFYGALILLGIGWNFGFIGATTMLTTAHAPGEKGVVQGLNDFVVFGFVTLASLASGGLMNCAGGTAEQGWTAVNVATAPALILALGALVWLATRPAQAPPSA
ncbi:MAG: MFS transporter [Paracoccaceae bacterium]